MCLLGSGLHCPPFFSMEAKTRPTILCLSLFFSLSLSLSLSVGCDSLPTRRSKRHTAMLVAKWGLVDAVFILSFMPLLYLVKQWSY